MAAAATTFGSLPELLRLLAEQVQSRTQLAELRLTSRAFAAATTPSLFCAVRVGEKGAQSLHELSGCGHLRYVKRLTIDLNFGDCNEIVQKGLLPKMPCLESFTWCNMHLASATLHALYESCPLVSAIHVTFPEEFAEADEVPGNAIDREPEPWQLELLETYGRPDLTMFTGLQELTLYNLDEDLPWWRSQLMQVLRTNASNLRGLALSFSPGTLFRYAGHGGREAFDSFFDQLGDEYGTTAPPLRIRSLVFGTGVYVHQLSSLEKLADLTYLRDVRIENGDVMHNCYTVVKMYDFDAINDSCIAFHAFGPARCPNLRRFAAARYRTDVRALFACTTADDLAWARRLAVSCEQMGDGFELAALLRSSAHGALPLHLRMLDVDLERERVFLVDEAGDALPEDEVPSAEQVLADLVAGDDGTLEGLAVHMAEEPGACDGRVQFRHLGHLTAALAQLANLTQLAVRRRSSLYSGLPEAWLVDAARMIAAAAPRLRYVNVYEFCWRVLRDAKGGGEEAVRLELLDDSEAADVELFSHTIWRP